MVFSTICVAVIIILGHANWIAVYCPTAMNIAHGWWTIFNYSLLHKGNYYSLEKDFKSVKLQTNKHINAEKNVRIEHTYVHAHKC